MTRFHADGYGVRLGNADGRAPDADGHVDGYAVFQRALQCRVSASDAHRECAREHE